jgi:hypothetical protein
MIRDKIIFTIGIILGLMVVSASGFLFYKNQLIIKNEELIIKEVATPVAEATIKPVDTNYKNIEIQVLNGSGKAGAAKKYADILSNLGYSKVSTGNYEEIVTSNLLFAPTDFGDEINLKKYEYKKSDSIKIVIGK